MALLAVIQVKTAVKLIHKYKYERTVVKKTKQQKTKTKDIDVKRIAH